MRVEAQLINDKGRSIDARDRVHMPKYRGQLRIREARSQAMGRIVTVADLISTTDGTDATLIPSLHDASVIFLESGKMRLRGFEVIDGAQYGQTWDVKVS